MERQIDFSRDRHLLCGSCGHRWLVDLDWIDRWEQGREECPGCRMTCEHEESARVTVDPDDSALDDDKVPRFFWYHTSTQPDWPKREFDPAAGLTADTRRRMGGDRRVAASAARQRAKMVRKRQLPVVGGGAGVWSFLHVDDAAEATALAIEDGAPGLYNVVDDDPAPVHDWLPYLAQAVAAKPPLRLPAWLVRPMIGEHGVSMMTAIRGSSNAKARREMGWQPRYASWRHTPVDLSPYGTVHTFQPG